MKAVFVRRMKESLNWDSLVAAECDITGERFQPSEDAAPELRHGGSNELMNKMCLSPSKQMLELGLDSDLLDGHKRTIKKRC